MSKEPTPADHDENPRWLGYVTRVLKRASTALSDGLGVYLVSMLVLGIVATLLHQAVRPNRLEREALRDLVETQQEPYRPETLPILMAALVSDTWDVCADEKARDLILESHRLFEKLYAGESARQEDFKALASLPPESFKPRTANRTLAPCSLKERSCPLAVPSDGEAAMTDDSQKSVLRVPSALAAWSRAAPAELQAVADQSAEIEAFELLLEKELGLGAHVAGLFFVSVEGVLRLLPHQVLKWPHHRAFHATDYMYNALEDEKERRPACSSLPAEFVKTVPYLDLAGSGVVSTICAPVKTGGTIRGVFCVDVGHGRDAVLAELQRRVRLFPMTLAKVDVAKNSVLVCGTPGFPADGACPRFLAARTVEERERMKAAAESWREQIGQGAGGAARIYEVADHLYAAGILKRETWYEVIIIDTKPRSGRSFWWLAAALALLIGTGGLVVEARRLRDRRREATLLRGLQMGVVRVDADDVIVGVNDRAQEILNRDDLPRLGLYSVRHRARNRVTFAMILGAEVNHVVVYDEYNRRMEVRSYEWIATMRRHGIANRYWFRKGERWIRVYGSPIALPSGQAVHTFGLLEWETAQSTRDELDRCML